MSRVVGCDLRPYDASRTGRDHPKVGRDVDLMATMQQRKPHQQHETSPDGTKTITRPPDLRLVPTGSVSVRDGFNPRTTRDPEAFGRTVFSVQASGVLQPILVTPTTPGAETFTVVAGEGRFLAAVEAGLPQVPVLVREVDERTGGLELALVENMAREELDPVAIAGAFGRLRETGWSKRQIAEYLSVTQKLVTERLQILQIPEALHPQIASGQIPLSAVRPLARLAQIHSELPAVLVARVLHGKPQASWMEPLDWATVVDDPIAALTLDYVGPNTVLPAGVYNAGGEYGAKDLPLTDQARDDLKTLAARSGSNPDDAVLRFTREGVAQALALKAAFVDAHGYSHLIVGDEIVGQVFADQLSAHLKQARRDQRARKQQQQHGDQEQHDDEPASGTGSPGEVESPASVEEQVEDRRRERAERLEIQRQARAYNAELGAAVLRHLVRLKLDERVLRVLLAARPLSDLEGLASRGARYCLPGWAKEEATKTGKLRLVFATPLESKALAREFLSGGSSVGEITGRAFSLVALARYADQRAVATSNHTLYRVPDPADLPWSGSVLDLIDEICADRLPAHLTEPARAERRAHRETEDREQREQDAARERLDGLEDRIADLDETGRAQALRDAALVYGRYGTETWKLRRKLDELARSPEGAATDPDAQPDPAGAVADDASISPERTAPATDQEPDSPPASAAA